MSRPRPTLPLARIASVVTLRGVVPWSAAAGERRIRWRRIVLIVGFALLVPLNFVAIGILADSWQVGVAPDFQQYADALQRWLAGEPLYGPDWKWRYSPVAILTLGPAIATGLVGWTVLHLAALFFVRPWWLAVAIGLSWPFWVDVVSGNTVTFVAVAAICAMRGSVVGAWSYWWLTLIMPRPVQIPMAIYLWWRRPELRRSLLVLAVLNGALLLLMGQWSEWISYLIARGAEDSDLVFNIHPAADLGMAWLLIGIPLAAVLAWRGWPGQAGVVLFPSLLAQYLLMAFVPPGRPMERGVAMDKGTTGEIV